MKEQILAAALRLAAKHGLKNLTQQQIATAAKVAKGSVTYHFKDMRKLLNAVVAQAIADRNLPVLVQAIAERHTLALGAPEELKKAAARHLAVVA